VIKEAHRFGFVDEGVLSADTTAQELPIGYPNEPGILRGPGAALRPSFDAAPQAGECRASTRALEQVQTIVRLGQRTPSVQQGARGKNARS